MSHALALAGGVVAVVGHAAWLGSHGHPAASGSVTIPMAPSTALLMVLLSTGIVTAHRGTGRRGAVVYGQGVAAAAALFSLAVLAVRLAGGRLVLEVWLAGEAGEAGGIPLGLMAPLTATTFLLLAGALLFGLPPCAQRRPVRGAGSGLAALALLVSVTVMVGYASGAPFQYNGSTIPMALATAAGFACLSLSLFLPGLADIQLHGPAAAPPERAPGASGWLLRLSLVSFGSLALATSFCGWFLISRQRDHERREVARRLSAVAELQAEQVAHWRAERLDVLRHASGAMSFRQAVQALALDRSATQPRQQAVDWLALLTAGGHLDRAELYDTSLHSLLRWFPDDATSQEESRELGAAMPPGAEVAMVGPRSDKTEAEPHLHLLARVRAPGPAATESCPAIGLLVVTISARDSLWPLLGAVAQRSDSAGSLLVRRDGNWVVYLSALRHSTGTAPPPRRSVQDAQLPEARALRGELDAIAGTDDQGKPVLAVARPVRGTDWVLVARIDQRQIYAPLTERALFTGAVVAALLLSGGLGFAVFWWQHTSQALRRELAAEHRSSALAARLADLTRYANDIILLADADGRMVEANERAVETYGYSLAELQHMVLRDLCPADVPCLCDEMAIRLEGTDSAIFQATQQRRDGSVLPVEVSARHLTLDGVAYHQLILRDITERISADAERADLEAQLHHSQRLEAIGRLAGGVAHDLNNVLTVILGFGELVLDSLPEDSPLRADIGEMVGAGERARDLTRQLLAFGRKQVLEVRVLALNDLVHDHERMIQRFLGEDIDVRVITRPEAGHTRADPSQLEQVLLNLCLNARDAMPRGGVLSIETSAALLDDHYVGTHPDVQPGPYVLLSVSDTGCGMNEETRQRAFEPFFTTKERGKGTGLGLSTVYGIIKQHGGDVRLYSEPGHGSTFRIYLPRVDADADAPLQPGMDSAVHGSGETVLLVEDDAAVRKMVCRMLTNLGYAPIEAPHGAAAVELAAEAERIDLLLTDVIMPELSGRQVFEQIAATHPGLRALFMSGYTEDVIVHHGVVDDGVHFIPKPFSELALSQHLREALGP